MKPRLFKRMTIASRLLWAFLVMALDVCFVNPSPVFLLDKAGD